MHSKDSSQPPALGHTLEENGVGGAPGSPWIWSPTVRSILKCMLSLTTGTGVRKAKALRFGKEWGYRLDCLVARQIRSFLRLFIHAFRVQLAAPTQCQHLLGTQGLVTSKAQSLRSRSLWSSGVPQHSHSTEKRLPPAAARLLEGLTRPSSIPAAGLWRGRPTLVWSSSGRHRGSVRSLRPSSLSAPAIERKPFSLQSHPSLGDFFFFSD